MSYNLVSSHTNQWFLFWEVESRGDRTKEPKNDEEETFFELRAKQLTFHIASHYFVEFDALRGEDIVKHPQKTGTSSQ